MTLVKDDEVPVTILLTEGMVLDQQTIPNEQSYWQMYGPEGNTTVEIHPYVQEVQVGISGILGKISIHSPFWIIPPYPGCCPECTMRIGIAEYYDGYWNDPPDTWNYLGFADITWQCYSGWNDAFFIDNNIFLNIGDKFIITIDGIIYTDSCMGANPDGTPYNQCLGLCVGGSYGRFGFWDCNRQSGQCEWKWWPGEQGNSLAFRSYMVI